MTIERVAIVGLGLIGGSVGLAVQEMLPGMATTGWDADTDVRQRAAGRRLVGEVCDTVAEAVRGADLVILCVPVGAMGYAAEAIAPHLEPGTIVSDVGSSKRSVGDALAAALPDAIVIPAHPVAGTENSGPDAGFPDLVLAVTSHIPHLIAYTIVGTASDLEDVTRGEVIKYSAGGFRDFTRIAASNPTMWRDVFLSNRDAVLEVLGRFTEDLSRLQRAIRNGDGDTLFDLFDKTRTIRRSIIEEGQDDARPDFGRGDH